MPKAKPEPRASRDAAGHTQRAAADALGVHYRTWQNWESGVAVMPPYALRMYRHVAGVERIPFHGTTK